MTPNSETETLDTRLSTRVKTVGIGAGRGKLAAGAAYETFSKEQPQ